MSGEGRLVRGAKNMLIALDGSPASERALVLTGKLALGFEARVTVLHVI